MLGPKRDQSVSEGELSVDVREAIAQLKRLRGERPELAEFADLYEQLLPRLFGPPSPALRIQLAETQMRDRLAAGVPLLRGVPLTFDNDAVTRCWNEVADFLSRARRSNGSQRLAQSVVEGELGPVAQIQTILQQGPAAIHATLDALGLDTQLEAILLRLTFLPILDRFVRELQADWTRLGWSRGCCPACGSWPLLAEFRGLEQLRWLRCGLCGSGWQVDRLFCPFCETRDHRQLQDLFVEGQEQKYRVSVCDACGGFVRSISTLVPLTAPALLVAELETFHLELVAHDRGYRIVES